MQTALHIGIILLSCAALGLGSAWLVDSAVRLAKRLGISELVIGLTVVAFGTSAPEFAVSINAACRGMEGVSVGNVIGSNIFNIGFILGGCALVASITTSKSLVRRDGLLLVLVTIALLAFLANGSLDRWEGIVMMAALIGYLIFLARKREPLGDEEISSCPSKWYDVPMLIMGLVLVVAGGYFLVESASALARMIGLSEWVIGMTIVAAGTSLPEFIISLVALLKKHHGISAGNLVGSNLFNTLGVLGVAGAIRPMGVESAAIVSVAALLGLTIVVLVFLRTGWRLVRWEGAVLILICLAMWLYNIQVGR